MNTTCDQCNRSFETLRGLKVHITRSHKSASPPASTQQQIFDMKIQHLVDSEAERPTIPCIVTCKYDNNGCEYTSADGNLILIHQMSCQYKHIHVKESIQLNNNDSDSEDECIIVSANEQQQDSIINCECGFQITNVKELLSHKSLETNRNCFINIQLSKCCQKYPNAYIAHIIQEKISKLPEYQQETDINVLVSAYDEYQREIEQEDVLVEIEQQQQEDYIPKEVQQKIDQFEYSIEQQDNRDVDIYSKSVHIQNVMGDIFKSNPSDVMFILKHQLGENHMLSKLIVKRKCDSNLISELPFAKQRYESYHQMIFKSHNIKPYFDIDFKQYIGQHEDIEKVVRNAIHCVLERFGMNSRNHKIVFHTNNKNTGFHITIIGIKSNIEIIKQFAIQMNEIITENGYADIVDFGIYQLSTRSLRLYGEKYDGSNKYHLDLDQQIEKYSICYTRDNDIFMPLPALVIQKIIQEQKNNNNKIQNYDKLTDDLTSINLKLQQYLTEKKLPMLVAKENKYNQYEIIPETTNCIVCKREHRKIKNMMLECSKYSIRLDCWSNRNKNKDTRMSTIQIWKVDIKNIDVSQIQQKAIKQLFNIPESEDLNEALSKKQQNNNLTGKHVHIQEIVPQINQGDNDIRIPQKELENIIANKTDIILASQLATGKTNLIRKIIDSMKNKTSVVWVTSRVTFANSLVNKFPEFVIYNTTKNCLRLQNNSRFIIQIESLCRLDLSICKPDLLIIDEYVSHISHFASTKIMRSYTTDVYKDLLQNSGQVIIADAHMNDEYCNIFKAIRIQNNISVERIIQQPEIYLNQYQPLQGKKAFMIDTNRINKKLIKSRIISKVQEDIKNNKKCVLFITHKTMAEELNRKLKELNITTEILTGDGDRQGYKNEDILHKKEKEEIIKNLDIINKVQVLIHTQTLTFGVSMQNHNEFTELYAFIDYSNSNGAQEIVQSLYRVRSIQQMTLYYQGSYQQPDLTTIEKCEQYARQFGFVSGTPERNAIYCQFILSQVALCKQRTNPNSQVIQYLIDIGMTVHCSYFQKSSCDGHSFKMEIKKQIDFTKLQISQADLEMFQQQETENEIDVQNYKMNKQALLLLTKFRKTTDFTLDCELNNKLPCICINCDLKQNGTLYNVMQRHASNNFKKFLYFIDKQQCDDSVWGRDKKQHISELFQSIDDSQYKQKQQIHQLNLISKMKRLAPIYRELERQLPYQQTIANISPLIEKYYLYKRINIDTERFIREKTIYKLSTYSDDLPQHTISTKTIEKFAKDITYNTCDQLLQLIQVKPDINVVKYQQIDIKKQQKKIKNQRRVNNAHN